MNYFTIERNGECYSHVILADSDGNPAYTEFLDMAYEEMKNSEKLEDFVITAMEAADRKASSGYMYDDTVVTLVGEDDCFIWGIIMGYDGEHIRYNLVNWKADGKNYRYAPDTP